MLSAVVQRAAGLRSLAFLLRGGKVEVVGDRYRRSVSEGAKLTDSEESVPTIAIFGEDWVFGQALELLLASVGCDARFLGEPRTDELGELLVGVKLLLHAPAVKKAWREKFLRAVGSSWPLADIPVIELVSAHGGEMSEREGLVPWPCRIEHLRREIETALANLVINPGSP